MFIIIIIVIVVVVEISLVFVPKEVLKQQLQAVSQNQYNTGSSAVKVNELIGMIRVLIRERGLCGFYSGFGASVLRNAPSNAINFYVFEKLRSIQLEQKINNDDNNNYNNYNVINNNGNGSGSRERVIRTSKKKRSSSKREEYYFGSDRLNSNDNDNSGNDSKNGSGVPHNNKKLSVPESMCTGAISGSVAALFTTPIDVVKTKIMTSSIDKKVAKEMLNRGVGVYASLGGTLRTIWVSVSSLSYTHIYIIISFVEQFFEKCFRQIIFCKVPIKSNYTTSENGINVNVFSLRIG